MTTENPTLLPDAALTACFEAVFRELHERYGIRDVEGALAVAAKALDAIDAELRSGGPPDPCIVAGETS